MKRILLSLMAFAFLSATLYADGGKASQKVKVHCTKSCCDACGSTCACD